MKIMLKHCNNGTLKLFNSKEGLYKFAKRYFSDVCFGESKIIDKIKNEDENITISEICEALSGSYKRIF